jgi:putative membrane protein (TIGR04086 family)
MEKQANQGLTNTIKEKLNFRSLIKGILVSYIITIPAFIIFSFILTYTDFPEKFIRTVVLITTIMSVMVAGAVAIRNVKSRGWLNGAFVGFIYIFVLYVLSSLVFKDFSIDKNVISMTAIGIFSGAIGGIIGINIQANANSRRRVGRR